MKAQEFLATHNIEIKETASAQGKLGSADALRLVNSATTITVAKSGKVLVSCTAEDRPDDDELLKHMLGPTGNLRAPTIRVGKKLIVGFHEEVYQDIL